MKNREKEIVHALKFGYKKNRLYSKFQIDTEEEFSVQLIIRAVGFLLIERGRTRERRE